MAAGYGWDWGPDLAGVGIWRSVGIESWSGVRLGSVRPLALVEGTAGRLETHVELEWADAAATPVEVAVTLGGQTVTAEAAPGQTAVVLELTVPDVELWWPLGYGAQTRYDVTVEVAGQSFDAAVGFRTAELSTTPGRVRHRLLAGGQRHPDLRQGLQLDPRRRAAHPADARHATAARSPRRSTPGPTCCGSGAAGSTRATTSTTSATSSGILVWQDFLFACAAYSEEEPLRGEVVAEAREAVTRLSSRPSLVVWNGNNENIWGYVEWGWRAAAGRSQLGQRLLHRAAAGHRGRAGPADPVLPRQPVLLRRLPPPQRPAQRHHAHLGRLEPARLHPLPRLPGPLRVRVRLPGSGRLVDAVLRRP